MVEIINLRRARKQKQKNEDQATAAQNRINHGRRKDEKTLTRRLDEQAQQKLENHRLTPDEST